MRGRGRFPSGNRRWSRCMTRCRLLATAKPRILVRMGGGHRYVQVAPPHRLAIMWRVYFEAAKMVFVKNHFPWIMKL